MGVCENVGNRQNAANHGEANRHRVQADLEPNNANQVHENDQNGNAIAIVPVPANDNENENDNDCDTPDK